MGTGQQGLKQEGEVHNYVTLPLFTPLNSCNYGPTVSLTMRAFATTHSLVLLCWCTHLSRSLENCSVVTFPSSVDLSICFLGRLCLSPQRGFPLLSTDLCDAELCSRSRVALTMKASECQPFQEEQKSKLKLNVMHKYLQFLYACTWVGSIDKYSTI